MRTLLAFIFITLVILPFILGDRAIARFNGYRGRVKIPGMRKLYHDKDMEELAIKAANECRKITEDGDYGVIYTEKGGQSPANIGDELVRVAYTNHKDPMKLERNYINVFSPNAYKTGCAFNQECGPKGLYVCYFNHKITHEEFILSDDPCKGCSPTFSKCEKVCMPEDDMIPERVPEDEPVRVQSNEQATQISDMAKVNVNLEETGGDTTSNGFIATYGLMNAVFLIFHLVFGN